MDPDLGPDEPHIYTEAEIDPQPPTDEDQTSRVL